MFPYFNTASAHLRALPLVFILEQADVPENTIYSLTCESALSSHLHRRPYTPFLHDDILKLAPVLEDLYSFDAD